MNLKVRQSQGYLWGSILILAGLLFFFLKSQFALIVFVTLAAIALLNLFYQIWIKWKRKEVKSPSWLNLILQGLLALFLVNNAILPTHLLALFMTLEFFAMGLILLLDFGVKWFNQLRPSLLILLDGLVHVIFGLIVLFNLDVTLDLIYRLFGLSLILRGLSNFWDAWRMDKVQIASKGRRKRLGLPIFLSALIPIGTLRAVNRLLSPDKSRAIQLANPLEKTGTPDLEVWIHTARRGFEMMGHVDISYKGVTYAYGLYNPESSRLFGTVGDGVLIRLSSQDYLDSLAHDDWRAVVGYGMVLTDQQQEAIEGRLAEIMSHTKPLVLQTEKQRQSYLGQLSNHYGVESFTFTNSQFKTYFVMTTNCVLLADTILEVIGTDNIANHGILTPGVYQDYFEKEYLNPQSAVISKFILGKKEVTEQ